MTAVLQFPSSRALAVRVEREWGGEAWLVCTHDREWGWLHGGFDDALLNPRNLASCFDVNVNVRSSGATL